MQVEPVLKTQLVLHVQHENKVLYPGLRAQRIATNHNICTCRLKRHCVETKITEFHYYTFSNKKDTTKSLVALAVWASILTQAMRDGFHLEAHLLR